MVYSEAKFPVRYYETDQMGIVHHSNYIRYFECARNELMNHCGYPIERCEAEGVTIPVVKVECRYKHPAKMGDTLTVSAMIDRMPMAKLLVRQEVRNQNGELCAEGVVTLGFLNAKLGCPTRCPEPLANAIEARLGDRPGPEDV